MKINTNKSNRKDDKTFYGHALHGGGYFRLQRQHGSLQMGAEIPLLISIFSQGESDLFILWPSKKARSIKYLLMRRKTNKNVNNE